MHHAQRAYSKIIKKEVKKAFPEIRKPFQKWSISKISWHHLIHYSLIQNSDSRDFHVNLIRPTLRLHLHVKMPALQPMQQMMSWRANKSRSQRWRAETQTPAKKSPEYLSSLPIPRGWSWTGPTRTKCMLALPAGDCLGRDTQLPCESRQAW